LRKLENSYPQQQNIDLYTVAGAIVLGGAQSNGDLVAERGTFLVNGAAERVIAIMELRRMRPDIPVIATGGSGMVVETAIKGGDTNRLFFEAVGIDPSSVVVENDSRNTFENAALTAPLLPPDDRPWLLVTSASHMPRSVMIFEDRGIDIIPYPVDYRARAPSWSVHRMNIAGRFTLMTIALKEYVGMAYFRFLQKS